MISLDYSRGGTLHEQIEQGIRRLIIDRVIKPDEQLPSVRELSLSLTVNPNTVQRAYKQLEQDGFIYSIKGKGSFAANPAEDPERQRGSEVLESLAALVGELVYLGVERDEVLRVINDAYAEKEDEK